MGINLREGRRPTKVLNYVNKGDKNTRPIRTLDLELWPEQGEHTQVALFQVLGKWPAFGDWAVVPKLKKFNPICTN
jgi:hypothetical protein